MIGLVTALSAGALGAVGIAETRFRLALLLVGSVLTGWLANPHGLSPMVRPSHKRREGDYRESSFPRFTRVSTGDRFPGCRARSQSRVAFVPLTPGLLLPKPIRRVDCHGLSVAELGSIVCQRPLVSMAGDDDSYSLGYPARVEARAALSRVDHQLGRSVTCLPRCPARTWTWATADRLTVVVRSGPSALIACGPCVARPILVGFFVPEAKQ
jgi:hypothetical protein